MLTHKSPPLAEQYSRGVPVFSCAVLIKRERSGKQDMYTPFLMIGYAAALLLVLTGLRMVRRSAPDLRGLRQLNRFLLCALGGVLLLALHNVLPPVPAVVAVNLFFFSGSLFLYTAAAEILGRRPRLLPLGFGLCLAALPVLGWFSRVHDNSLARLLIHCGVLAVTLSFPALLLLRRSDPALRHAVRACAWLVLSLCLLNAAWCVFGVLRRSPPSLMYPGAADAAFSYLSLLLGLGSAIALAWLALCVHRLDLQRMAQTDSLTGLLNRRAFDQILRRELLRARYSGQEMGVILIDLDYFKRINDSLGHRAGDDVLRSIAATLRDSTRPSDVLARHGGEEFLVLLRGTGLEPSERAAQRICAAIANLRDLPGEVSLTASIGVAVSRPDEPAEALLLRADEALYRSKHQGRNRVSVHRPSENQAQSIG